MAEEKAEQKVDKSDLVNRAMQEKGIPSWEAWDMTIPNLKKLLEATDA